MAKKQRRCDGTFSGMIDVRLLQRFAVDRAGAVRSFRSYVQREVLQNGQHVVDVLNVSFHTEKPRRTSGGV